MKHSSYNLFVVLLAACLATVKAGLTHVSDVKTLPYNVLGETLVFDFASKPAAASEVTVTATFQGDLTGVNSATVAVGASAVASLCDDPSLSVSLNLLLGYQPTCGTDSKTVAVDASLFNNAGKTVSIAIDALVGLNSILCDGSAVTIEISYDAYKPVNETDGDPHLGAGLIHVSDVKTLPYNVLGETLVFDFASKPAAATEVTVTATFQGDLTGVNSATVAVGASAVASLCDDPSLSVSLNLLLGYQPTCGTDSKTVAVDASLFNNAGKTVSIAIDALVGLNSILCDGSAVTIEISYDAYKPVSQTGGDPHFTTWNNEHFEYHGQCDLTLVTDADFADGLGLDIHIRTKIVRYWSYIKNVALKLGNDILEIEGSADMDDTDAHFWINFEYQGDIDTFSGFPVTQKVPSVYKRQYIVDLSSKYPGASIVVQLYKEFVRVKFNGDKSVFGNTVGLLGDYTTGKTIARDGVTELHDFTEFGDEWQVLPSEPRLFREATYPQFPEACVKPEDPRGDRKRRLAESNISIEDAEAACATLKDPLTIKDCVYDILATQDMDMVGAF